MLNDDVLDLTSCHYALGGRGPRHFDCMGFVLHAYKLSGIDVPDPHSSERALIANVFRDFFEEVPMNQMRKGDLIEIDSPGILGGHLAIAAGKTILIHCLVKKGVILSNVAMLEGDIRHVYRPKDWIAKDD